MLLGAEIHVHTDHKNLTHTLTAFQTGKIVRWRLIVEEHGAKFHYKPGEKNVVADAISRVPTTNGAEFEPLPKAKVTTDVYTITLDDPEMAECLMEYPLPPRGRSLTLATLAEYQQKDNALKALIQTDPDRYSERQMSVDQMIICYRENPQATWRMAIPDAMLPHLINWYHTATAHTEGVDRLFHTINQLYFHPRLRREIHRIVSPCVICQRMKTGQYQYGALSPRQAPLFPWRDLQVDCIGQWTIKVRGHVLKFNALTIMDSATNLMEVVRIPSDKKGKPLKTAAEIARLFQNHWLARCPRPVRKPSPHCRCHLPVPPPRPASREVARWNRRPKAR